MLCELVGVHALIPKVLRYVYMLYFKACATVGNLKTTATFSFLLVLKKRFGVLDSKLTYGSLCYHQLPICEVGNQLFPRCHL